MLVETVERGESMIGSTVEGGVVAVEPEVVEERVEAVEEVEVEAEAGVEAAEEVEEGMVEDDDEDDEGEAVNGASSFSVLSILLV